MEREEQVPGDDEEAESHSHPRLRFGFAPETVGFLDEACRVLGEIGGHDETVLGLLQLKGNLLVKEEARARSDEEVPVHLLEQQHESSSEEAAVEDTDVEEGDGADVIVPRRRAEFAVLANVEYESEDSWDQFIPGGNSAEAEPSEEEVVVAAAAAPPKPEPPKVVAQPPRRPASPVRQQEPAQPRTPISDRKVAQLKSRSLELLQQIALVKKNDRAFKDQIAQVLDARMDPARAVEELRKVFARLRLREKQQLHVSSLLSDERTDAEIIEDVSHPIEQLTTLTRNINVQEASYHVLVYFFRLEGQFSAQHVPFSGLCIERAFRFWRVAQECHMYPLYSALLSHVCKRVTNALQDRAGLALLMSEASFLYFCFRNEEVHDPAEDKVRVRHVDQTLLDMVPLDSDPLDEPLEERGLPYEHRVTTVASLWRQLRRQVIKCFCGILKLTYNDVFAAVQAQVRELHRGGPAPSHASVQLPDVLASLHRTLREAHVPKGLQLQIVRQLFYYVNAALFNSGLLDRSYLKHAAATVLRADLDAWDDWLKRNCPMHRPAFLREFRPVSESLNVIFMKKSLLRRPEIREEVCPSLNVYQLQQLLSGYTPAPTEEEVPLALLTHLIGETLSGKKAGRRVDIEEVLIDKQQLHIINLRISDRGWMCPLAKEEVRAIDFPQQVLASYPKFRDEGEIPVIRI